MPAVKSVGNTNLNTRTHMPLTPTPAQVLVGQQPIGSSYSRSVKLQTVCLFILRKMSALTLGGVDCRDEPRGNGVEKTTVSCLERGQGRRR